MVATRLYGCLLPSLYRNDPLRLSLGFKKKTCGEGACSRWVAKQSQKPSHAFVQVNGIYRIHDRYAAEREQAPSPQ
jgi:hypothetical protein